MMLFWKFQCFQLMLKELSGRTGHWIRFVCVYVCVLSVCAVCVCTCAYMHKIACMYDEYTYLYTSGITAYIIP